MFKSGFQIFIENFVQSLLSIVKVFLQSRSVRKYFRIAIESNECLILGNGPSLKDSFNENKDFFKSKTLFAVNHFAQSDLFLELQPRFYILNAPEMWMDDVEEFHYKKGEQLFRDIAQNTQHEMDLFINRSAVQYTRWKKFLADNHKIRIHYFNTTPTEGFRFLKHFLFRNMWGMPRSHNVLIPSIMIALQLRFKKIYLAGADHNWLKDIYVSPDNRVFLTQKHFYDAQTAEQRTMDKMGKGERRLHEILHKFAVSLNSYFIISDYAKTLHTEIINITPDSFIDAFEKKTIQQLEKV
jgi:hypothetical protein